jgi:hypothetical protein
MSILDLQAMEPTTRHGGDEGSDVSLLLCTSDASVTLC